jgi:hypothetical protein
MHEDENVYNSILSKVMVHLVIGLQKVITELVGFSYTS